MFFVSDLVTQFFSFKNGLELVTGVLAFFQALYLLKRSNSAILFAHSLFLLLLGIHFLLLNVQNVFGFEIPVISLVLLFFYGPLLYINVRLIDKTVLQWKKVLLVFLFISLLLALFYQIWPEIRSLWTILFNHLYIDTFIVLGLIRINRIRKKLSTELVDWIVSFLLIFLVTNTAYILAGILELFNSEYFLFIKTPVAILFILLILNNYRTLVFNNKLINQLNASDSIEPHHVENIKLSIESALKEKELYLNPELELADLANEISYPSRLVSSVINNNMNTSFYEYVNELRLNKAIELMQNREDLLIKQVMYDSGFGNKVTFNKAFKTKFGCTPSQYRSNLFTH